MPRIPPRLLRQASSIGPLLRKLLPVTRDLQSAKNELRWLREHAVEQSQRRSGEALGGAEQHRDVSRWLNRYCDERGRGKPLQYILGTEFFGDLEIKCEEGVLIPRWETASLVEHFATVIHARFSTPSPRPLKILEPCTGTGCMSLLLQHTLTNLKYPAPVHTLGLDISPQAIQLARHNLSRHPHVTDGHKDSTVDFQLANVLHQDSLPSQETTSVPSWQSVLEQYDLSWPATAQKNASTSNHLSGSTMIDRQSLKGWDILLSNPPYVSPGQYARTTSLSVRKHEPRIALVPPSLFKGNPVMTDEERGDVFYPALLDMARKTGVRGVIFEIGDAKQAGRVVGMVEERMGREWEVEVWRDEPAAKEGGELAEGEQGLEGMLVRGKGRVRGVFAWREGPG
ncbi:S-adenosyl-L-methionine-dependent methyltransferase [Elsinoe ampelina]|uniref:S-adenosyl-L-methionine-dependent methyltransferase n=1 Tax=Elsinoe ampelina TaxID=302913 RepID=A0A6A6FZZ4_9PEZI|nr:S-adenosyl-L-methionine-dependent methyltransferase [Elsinoe ampelina]